jgi:PAS domain S-box-containing protein
VTPDVTSAGRGARAASDAEAWLAALVTGSADAIVGKLLDGTVTVWNAAAERLLGYTAAEMLGRPVLVVIPPERHAEEADFLARAARGEPVPPVETERVRKDGERVPVSLTVSPIRDAGGRVVGAANIVRDIRRQRFAAALAERLRDLADPEALVAEATTALGEHLGVARVGYAEVDRPAAGGGTRPLDSLGPAVVRDLEAGRTVAVADLALDPRTGRPAAAGASGARSLLAVPLVNHGRLAALLFLHHAAPRAWAPDEVALVEETGGRLWAAVERARAEAALRAREAEFRAMADNIPQLAWMADAAGAIYWFNRRWYEYTGATFEEMRGLGWRRVHHPDYVDGVVARMQRAWAAGKPWEDTFPMRARTGEWRWFLSRANPIRDEAGRVVRWFGTNTDVTGQREAAAERERLLAAERTARERTDRLQTLTAALSGARTPGDVVRVAVEQGLEALGASGGMMALLEPGAARADAAASAAAHLALVEAHGYTGTAAELLPRLARVPLDADVPVAEAVRTGRPVVLRSAEERARRYPRIAEPLAGYGSTVALPLVSAGAVIGAFVVHRPAAGDLDDEALAFMEAFARLCAQALERARLYEAELQSRAAAEQERERAERANAAKSQFLAVMSHELRTPLNAIAGYTQLLDLGLRGPVNEAQRSDLARIKHSQEHLLGLINDVLNFAKLEAGRVEFDVRETRVADVVADVMPLVEPQLRAKGLACAVALAGESAGEAPLLVWADRDKLGQVLLNLLSNAVKFTPARRPDGTPGRIVVELLGAMARGAGDAPGGGVRADPTRAHLRVGDTGVGIPRERQATIFDPFVQVRSGLTREHEGTGLGLAISRDLARGMGGDLTVESAEGAGATFTVVLRRVTTPSGERVDRRARRDRRRAQDRRHGE